MTGRLALAGDATDDIQRSLLSFIQDRMEGWSREQAEVVELKLRPNHNPTQGEIATRLGITRQAVGARLQAAGFDLIQRACDAVYNHPAFQPQDA
jgi:DNA-directed RNA polymerase specialized sigma subunit